MWEKEREKKGKKEKKKKKREKEKRGDIFVKFQRTYNRQTSEAVVSAQREPAERKNVLIAKPLAPTMEFHSDDYNVL